MKLLAQPVGMIIAVLLLDYLDVITLSPIGTSTFLTSLVFGPSIIVVSFLIWIIPYLIVGFVLEVIARFYLWSDQTQELVGLIVVLLGSVPVNWLSLYVIGTLTKLAIVPTFFEGGLNVGMVLTVPALLIVLYDWAKKYM